jgi:hypothetical protein
MYFSRNIQLIALLISASSLLHAETGNMMDKHMSSDAPASHSGHMDLMKNMDTQLDVMKDMHQKMAAAKTDTERQSLTKEHFKVMQDSIAMMDKTGEERMKCMASKKGGESSAKKQRQMLDKHMKMMHSMMQMMNDHMGAVSKP